ncbi:MAG: helix-turn-helix domain-containing protein [Clostridiales bacterium]|nr:helix-turn-helix domain-containing protein [Clostridiales bacterium]
MGSKSTDDLRQELMTQSSIDSYIKENRPYFADRSVTELLTVLFRKKSMSKAELARQAAMSEVYLHQVFSGRRKPSRDRLLCICIGMGATLEETQRLLEQATYAQLYPRIKREAILCHGIVHHTPLSEINETLFAENEKTLF